MEENKKSQIVDIQKINLEVTNQFQKQEVVNALVTLVFPQLSEKNIKLAVTQGLIRGFSFQDFLTKKVYAVPFGEKYSLVESIDSIRSKGLSGGIVGKSAPTFEEKDGKIISCSITLTKKTGEHLGEFTATCYMDEYTTGYGLWKTKPRVMLAKVTEASVYRMACPSELAGSYTEEEMGQATYKVIAPEPIDIAGAKAKLEATTNLDELKSAFLGLDARTRVVPEIVEVKENLKVKFTPK